MSAFALVHLGDSVPAYLGDCLQQIRRFNPDTPVFLIVDHESATLAELATTTKTTLVPVTTLELTREIRKFDALSSVDRNWRGGFNFHAIKRFFYLDCLMREHELSRVVHLEYDNLVYFELSKLLPAFERNFQSLGLILDNDERCIPGVLYIHDAIAMQKFVRWYLSKALGRTDNDMRALALYRKKKLKAQLPIVPKWFTQGEKTLSSADGHVVRKPRDYSELADDFQGVFDAAAIGQYLGGVDPRNQTGDTRGFINEACVFSPADFEYSWTSDSLGRRLPWATSKASGRAFQVLNLHVHSKNLGPFLS